MFIPVAAAASPVPEQETIDLNGEWKVARLPIEDKGATGYRKFLDGKATTIRAQVPGEIHLDLMRAGEMKDPSVG